MLLSARIIRNILTKFFVKRLIFALSLTNVYVNFRVLGRYGFGMSDLMKEAARMTKNFKRIYCLQSNKVRVSDFYRNFTYA